MKISSTSWHYRYIKWAWGSVPKSLCPYVDGLLIAVVFAPFVLLFKGLAAGMRAMSENLRLVTGISGYALIYAIILTVLGKHGLWWEYILILEALVSGGFGLAYAGYLVLSFAFSGFWDWYHSRHMPKPPKPKKVKAQKPKQPKPYRSLGSGASSGSWPG